jgi:hypothetical protein
LQPKVLENFIDYDDCKLAIEYLNKKQEKNKLLSSEMDNRLFEWNPKSSECLYLIKKYSAKIFDAYNLDYNLYTHVAFLVKYDVGSFAPLHSDIMDERCTEDKLSLVLYFNDDYVGGDIYFPKLEKQYHPSKGTALAYEADNPNFDHGVNKIEKGTKYILAFCFTKNKSLSQNEYL